MDFNKRLLNEPMMEGNTEGLDKVISKITFNQKMVRFERAGYVYYL